MTSRHILFRLLSRGKRHPNARRRTVAAADITDGQCRLRRIVEVLAAAHRVASAVSGVPGAGARAHAWCWDFANHVAGADVAADTHGFIRGLIAELGRAAGRGAAWGGGSGWGDCFFVGHRPGHVHRYKGSVGIGVV